MPSNIIVSVLGPSGGPLKDAAVTLTGNGTPQNSVTEAPGKVTFQNVPSGQYKIVVIHEDFNTMATTFKHVDTADTPVTVNMNVADDADAKRFFRKLTAVEYGFLGFLAAVFAFILIYGLWQPDLDLSKTESARGMITFVV